MLPFTNVLKFLTIKLFYHAEARNAEALKEVLILQNKQQIRSRAAGIY
jgi:hypothetical protein